MKLSWRTEWPHWILLAVMFALAAATWDHAPDRIPVHWGLSGQVDRYGGRFEGLLVMPLLTLGLYFLLIFLPRLDPGRANYPLFSGAFAAIRLSLTLLMAVIYGAIHFWIRNHNVPMDAVVMMAVGALFILLGNVMGKIRPNWFVGIRTPWTLSSKLAWTRTHRLGGWLFFAMGLIMMAAVFVARPWFFAIVMSATLICALVMVVYSYFVWRKDPDKTPPAGSLPG